jgi:hypothetical protein
MRNSEYYGVEMLVGFEHLFHVSPCAPERLKIGFAFTQSLTLDELVLARLVRPAG